MVRHLATGGMANVYLARVSGLGGFQRHVVIKTLDTEQHADESYVSMFLDEARLIATLHHQHVAQVFEVGRAHDGKYYLAMEYVHGETVRAVLETVNDRHIKLPLEFGITVTCAAAAGLHHAHERCAMDGSPLQIVHRDVSPSNVIVSYDGSIKLIDFGIAKAAGRATRTETGFIKGKSGYMAPEQALGYDVDRRSDVFALGVLAYELTTQRRAFRAESQFEVLQRIVNGDLRKPSEIIAGYPAELEAVIMTALETDPDDRYQDAEEMRRALAQVADDLGFAIGDCTVIRVLHELFGSRPEPWLVKRTASNDEAPPIDETAPLLMYPAPDAGAIAFARGTVVAGVIDPDEILTEPFEAPKVPPVLPPILPPILPAIAPPMPRPLAAQAPRPRRATPLPSIAPPMLVPASIVQLPITRPDMPRRRPRANRIAPWLLLKRRRLGPAIVAFGVAIGISIGMIAAVDDNNDTPAKRSDVARVPAKAVAPPAAQKPALKTMTRVAPAPAPAPPAATAPPPVAAIAPATAEPAVVADTIALRVTTDPAGATVVLDGVRLGVTPYTATLPLTQGGGWLKVRKKQHAAVKTRVDLAHDVTWDVRLPALRKRPAP